MVIILPHSANITALIQIIMEIIKQDYAKKLVMEAPSNKTTQKDA